jgi:hypothetical protein
MGRTGPAIMLRNLGIPIPIFPVKRIMPPQELTANSDFIATVIEMANSTSL